MAVVPIKQEQPEPDEAPVKGFEYQGVYYEFTVSAKGKDLLLIDRISGMPVADFFELIEDDYDLGRAPVTLTLIATSMRARHPDRSVERILRTVMELDLNDDIEMVREEASEEPIANPPDLGGKADHSVLSPQTSESSPDMTWSRSPEIPAYSGHPGSPTGSTSNGPT